MKRYFFSALILVFLPSWVAAQASDSIAMVRQVDSLVNICRELLGASKFEEAIKVIEVAEQVALSRFGEKSAIYAKSIFNHGRIFRFWGKNDQAEVLYLKAKEIRANVLGKEHPDYASSLNNLANLYAERSQYDKAEPLFLESRDIRAKVLGKDHPDYASSLNNLGVFYQYKGNFNKSELFYLEAISIRERVLSKQHPDYASSLNNLGGLYVLMGRYAEAESLIIESKSLTLQLSGKESREYGGCISNLGAIYTEMGRYSEAEPLLIEAKDLVINVLGKKHPNYAISLNNLASLYRMMGRNTDALPLYLEAVDIWESGSDIEYLAYTMNLFNLAALYFQMGAYTDAEQWYIKTKTIRANVLGYEHPDYAWTLSNLAKLYSRIGRFDEAENLYLEAQKVEKEKLGKQNSQYISTLNNLISLYQKNGTYVKSDSLLKESDFLTQSLLLKSIRNFSEREITDYIQIFEEGLSSNLSFALARLPGPGVIPAICYNNALFYKGFLLNNSTSLRQLVAVDSACAQTANHLASFQFLMDQERNKPLEERSQYLPQWEQKADSLEKYLLRSVPGYEQAVRPVKWQDVQASLKSGEVAIEFVQYQLSFPNPTDSLLYAALVLLSTDTVPHFIPLFEEKELAPDLERLLENPEKVGWEFFRTTYRGAPVPGKSRWQLIWQPIEPLLGGVKTVYFSAAGLLQRINLGAIHLPGDSLRLADRYQLIQLGSTRQLVADPNAMTTPSPRGEAVLFGGIRYPTDTTAMLRAVNNFTAPEARAGGSKRSANGFVSGSSTRGGFDFQYLPGSDKEVRAIESVLRQKGVQAKVLTGYQGLEEAFMRFGQNGRPSPRILHLSTHGFSFPDIRKTAGPALRSEEPVYKLNEDPMYRSGLLLAGCEAGWRNGQSAHPKLLDGILTAKEVSRANLRQTELVVLSACKTGLGQLSGHEGVYGLQRAFKIAGARYLLMTLWNVDDAKTQEFMTLFYQKWLAGATPMTIPAAFRAAQQEMRAKNPNPYYWAGFVLIQ